MPCCFNISKYFLPPPDGAHVTETRQIGGTFIITHGLNSRHNLFNLMSHPTLLFIVSSSGFASLRYNTINYFKISLLRVAVKNFNSNFMRFNISYKIKMLLNIKCDHLSQVLGNHQWDIFTMCLSNPIWGFKK